MGHSQILGLLYLKWLQTLEKSGRFPENRTLERNSLASLEMFASLLLTTSLRWNAAHPGNGFPVPLSHGHPPHLLPPELALLPEANPSRGFPCFPSLPLLVTPTLPGTPPLSWHLPNNTDTLPALKKPPSAPLLLPWYCPQHQPVWHTCPSHHLCLPCHHPASAPPHGASSVHPELFSSSFILPRVNLGRLASAFSC